MVQTARLDLNDHFIRAGLRLGQIAKLEFARRAVSDELNGFHAGIVTRGRQAAEKKTLPVQRFC